MTALFLFLMIVPITFSIFRHLLQRDPGRTEAYVYGVASGGLFALFALSVSNVVQATEGVQGISILLCFAYAAVCAAALMTASGQR